MYSGMEGSYGDICIVKQRYDKWKFEIISDILKYILLGRAFHTTVKMSLNFRDLCINII